MKRIAWLCSIIATCLISFAVQAQQPQLTVYTYGSFVSKWGPGAKLAKQFESQCECKIRYVSLDDGVSILNRLRLERAKTQADAIVGLDTNLMPQASALKLVQPHHVDTSALRLPEPWRDPNYLPLDRGQFAFIYNADKLKNPPHSLKELVESFPGKIVYEDPRTSTPGLGLMLWMKKVFPKHTEQAWKKLQQKTVTVTKSWDDAYGMFLQGQADMVLSYTTSPVYHQLVEKKQQYKVAHFSEGHYQQVELSAVSAYAQHPELARQFLAYLITPEAQRIIAMNNWMLPVRNDVTLPSAFDEALAIPALSLNPDDVTKYRKTWLRQWIMAVSR